MTRMVEEERTQMGTLKAIGYSSRTIASKYLIYSIFASILGVAIGIVTGIYLLPFAIFKAYSIMFSMPPIVFTFPVVYLIIGTVISLATTIIASAVASYRELKVNPALLMRPKAPKPGKRVLLERIRFIWKRLSFTSKVTIRNLFRKKSRLIMTVLGIGGCTALILGSVGLYFSVNNIMKEQYDVGGIANYDLQIVFDEEQKDDSVLVETLRNDMRIKDMMLTSMISLSGGSERVEKTEDVYLFVPKNSSELNKYINLQNRKTNESITLDDTGAVISEKFANDTDTVIGDKIWVETADSERIEIPVANITENYTFSYVYLSENLYQYLFQESVDYSYAICNLDDIVFEEGANGLSKEAQFTAELMNYSDINAVAFISDTIDSLNEVINVLSFVILIFVISAGILAYIVLYNLTNINISERHRELATIKVLGFHDKEVSEYIYRENVILTLIGIILGLGAGVIIHKLLIVFCSVDAVMFVQTLTWYSYLIATGLTAVFALIVNAIMHKKMKKIDMVTSLKAIE